MSDRVGRYNRIDNEIDYHVLVVVSPRSVGAYITLFVMLHSFQWFDATHAEHVAHDLNVTGGKT